MWAERRDRNLTYKVYMDDSCAAALFPMALLHSCSGLSTTLSHSSDSSSSPSLRGVRMPSLSLPKKIAGFSSSAAVFSVRAFQSVRRPYLPQVGLLSKPTTLISERVICTDVQPGRKLELRYAKEPSKDFCDFIETTPKSEIVAFFRDVAGELEGYRQLRDFHMKIRDGEGDFRVEVFFGDEKDGPESLPDDECIACCPNANLFPGQEPGMEAGECILEGFSDEPRAVCRLDAKGRSGFAITPVRHVVKMSDLDDEELFALWSVAVRLLRYAELPFISMILNHGTYRTLHHLHLKVWVENELHQHYRSTWSKERKEFWNRLQELALNRPKKQQTCIFFRKDNSCRHGDLCSFLHVD